MEGEGGREGGRKGRTDKKDERTIKYKGRKEGRKGGREGRREGGVVLTWLISCCAHTRRVVATFCFSLLSLPSSSSFPPSSSENEAWCARRARARGSLKRTVPCPFACPHVFMWLCIPFSLAA
jgi:hypothetical protein